MVFTGIIFFAMMILATIAIDLSMLQNRRNGMQTVVDAAALAGALQLLVVPGKAVDTAIAWGNRNLVMRDTMVLARSNITYGQWNDTTHTFTPMAGSDTAAQNAIQVLATQSAPYLMARLFGFSSRTMPAKAIAWDGAPVQTTSDCVKPFSMPYKLLAGRLQPGGDSTRTLTQADIDHLNRLTAGGFARDSLSFNLKNGSGSSSVGPGNYLAVDLPSAWRIATGQYVTPAPTTGGSAYRTSIGTCNTAPIQTGDSLQVETGNMIGPTNQGVTDLCGGTSCSSYDNGKGYPMKAALWLGAPNGRSNLVAVKLMGGFRMLGVSSSGGQSFITGYFVSLNDPGSVGPSTSALQKVILVK
jgi:hypothetical protein